MKKTLKAFLRKNQLTENPNDFVAQPVTNGSVNAHDIAQAMQKEGMEFKTETVIDIVSRFNRMAADMVLSGYNVNTGLVYMRPSIKGVFFGKTWEPNKHNLYVAISQGSELRKAIAETSVDILGEQADLIEILSLLDNTTGKTDGTLTKGRPAEIKGSYLKVAGENENCGITFRNIDTKAEIKLPSTDIILNEPSRLLIMIPTTLKAGEYELKITTQFTAANKLLKEPRTAILGFPVIVA